MRFRSFRVSKFQGRKVWEVWKVQTELWYTDEHTQDVRFSMKAAEQIASKKSAVQQIDILDTSAYGRILILDGELFITEKDEFIYHEMLAHVPMAVHPKVRNVLVIGVVTAVRCGS